MDDPSAAPYPIPEIRQRREVAKNTFFTFAEEQLALPAGGDYTYFHLESNFDAVVVIPLLADGRVVVERIYRHPYRRYLVEFPAGGIDSGEDPCAAGKRELQEETGYIAGAMQHLLSYEAVPGLLRMRIHLVLASDLQQGGQRDRDAMELLQVEIMTRAEAWALATAGGASSFLSVGLLTLQQHLDGGLGNG